MNSQPSYSYNVLSPLCTSYMLRRFVLGTFGCNKIKGNSVCDFDLITKTISKELSQMF